MTLRTAYLTHTGRKRRHNEDSYIHEPPLFAVADGMGGAKAGEVASGLAVESVRVRPDVGGDAEAYVVELIQEANRRVYTRASEDASAAGMGTTMTVALVDDKGGRVTIGHVGDSRAYRVREGKLEQLTDDHSLVGELIRSGKLTPEEAEVHPQRSVITRALGTDPDVDVDTFVVDARPGDTFLICSDGLSSMVDDQTILAVVSEHGRDLQGAAKGLIAAANRGGGDDNITVVVFALDGEGDFGGDGATQRMDAIAPPGEEEAEAEPEPEDEDTLTGLEAPPAVGTMVVSVDELHQQAADAEDTTSEHRRPWRGSVLALVALLAFLAVLALLLLWAAANGGIAEP